MTDQLAVKQILATIGVLIVVGGLGGLAFIYSGLYNVAADKETSGLKEWVLRTTMHRSVEARLDEVGQPPDLDDSDLMAAGAEHYDAMCAGCHAAPGAEAGELAEGLNPPPPDLVEEGPEADPRELFWVTKHGIEMTGMPAWGTTHDDESIWGIVALMKQFKGMSAEEYEQLVEQAKSGGHHHGGEGHDHGGHEHEH